MPFPGNMQVLKKKKKNSDTVMFVISILFYILNTALAP